MTYQAPDGTILESSPTEAVTHQCETTLNDGVYISYETTYANNIFGIQQIKVQREVADGFMTITIIESMNDELQSYLDSLDNNASPDEMSSMDINQLIN
jgi:hypothetical protein